MNRILLLVFFMLAATGCQEMIYSNRVDVPFSSVPAVAPGAAVRFDGRVIGRVDGTAVREGRLILSMHVVGGALPERAVFSVSSDPRGAACMDVYRVPDNLHAERGPYWGVTSDLELAADLGREHADALWSDARSWLLAVLGGSSKPPARK